jgi:hypothetical protein
VTSDKSPIPEIAPQSSDQSSDLRLIETGNSLITEVNSGGPPPITTILLDTKDEHEEHEKGNAAFPPASNERQLSDELSAGRHSPSRSLKGGENSSPPPRSFRNSLTMNIKRFSTLPRTPSLSSRSSKSSHRLSAGAQLSARSPSPVEPIQLPLSAPVPFSSPPRPRHKIRSHYPSAMYCSEVFSRKTAGERCSAYAQKINQLYVYDSGLGDWIIETKIRGT